MTQPDTKAKKEKLRVLNLEDEPADSSLIRAQLATEWATVELLRVETREIFILALNEFKPDVVLSDFRLPDFDGRSALILVRQTHPDIPLIIVTGALSDIEAVELVKLGARDYVKKDNLTRLNSAVQSALSQEQGIRARKAMEQALQQNEADLRALVECSPVAMIVDAGTGDDEKVVMMNRHFTELFGYTLEDVPDVRHWWPLAYPDKEYREAIKGEWNARVEKAIKSHIDIEPMETTVACKDGSIRYVRISLSSIGDKNIVTFEDLTERREAEAKIRRLGQLYATLSHCNQAIVHSKNEHELFAQTCKAAVEFGGFKMAWIGLLDPDTQMIKPAFSFGEAADEYLREIQISADADSVYGQGPSGCALRDKQPFWCQDFLNSPLTAPWHERVAALGWRSSAALPLCRDGVVFGVFTLYASELNAFDQDARKLLIEMSADINFGLDNFKRDAVRKQAEASLRQLSLAVEQSPNSIVITDLDANLEYVNEAFVTATGYSREEVIGQNPRILHSGKNSRETYDDMWAHLSRGELWKGEFINRRKDGSEYLESIFVSPVRDADGRVTHYLGIKEDITERKRMEKALQESEEKFRVMGTSAQDGIVMIDHDENISFWNGVAEKIFGYPACEALGKNLHLLLAPARFREASAKGFAHFQRSGEGDVVGKTLELTALHKNGNEFLIELSLSAVSISGAWNAIGIVRDITERKQNEAQVIAQYELVAGINTQLLDANKQLAQAQSQLLQSEKMAAIGLLAAGVAHEINNPIGYVNSNLGSLEKYLVDIFIVLDKFGAIEAQLGAGNPLLEELRQLKAKVDLNYIREDVHALLAESHQGLERVKKIVIDLKEFSHADREDHWELADVHALLDSTLNVVWNELKYKCEVVKEYGTLPQIYCLSSQLNQVFMNLLVNAAQAIEVRGKITLRTGQEGDSVWIEVNDTGNGIPPENIPHLFDPFFTTKPVGKGTGLGLSVSYKIVEKHHGKIEVHSEIGKGTAFRVLLPVQQPDAKEQA